VNRRLMYFNVAGPCARPGCGELPESRKHQHLVAWACDGSDGEASADCHRFICSRHGSGGDLDHIQSGFTRSFCGRCTIDILLHDALAVK
jgi:hypothetical protein